MFFPKERVWLFFSFMFLTTKHAKEHTKPNQDIPNHS